MPISRLSIQHRITLLVGFCLSAIVAGLTGVSLTLAYNTNDLVKSRISQTLHTSTEQRLLVEANLQSRALRNFFLAAFKDGKDLASQASDLKRSAQQRHMSSETLRRELINIVTLKLGASPELLSMYVVFKPDALDLSDSTFKGRPETGSNETGRFAFYASQNQGRFFSMATPEKIITDDTPGLDGSPFSSWFDCPISTKNPCLLHPYFDDSSGRKTLITTLSFPILESGTVIGVAGLDISLEQLQLLVDQAAPTLYEGASTINIITSAGVIAGASAQSDILGSHLELRDNSLFFKKDDLRALTPQVWSDEKSFTIISPTLPIPYSSPWTIVIRVPKAKIFSPALELQHELDSRSSDNFIVELIVGLSAGAIGLIFTWFTAKRVTKPLLSVAGALKEIAAGGGDLTKRVGYGRPDELGQLCSWFNQFLDMLQPLIRDIQRLAIEANHTARTASELATDLGAGMQQQFSETEQVAAASHQMSISASDVANSATQAAEATRAAEKSAKEGLDVIALTTSTIHELARSLEEAMIHAKSLFDRSETIGAVLQVIHSIAEQTNLLALNAAIEAARAGESGRGFAVVADEVRNLAKHTRDSVEEIRVVIEALQLSTRVVHAAMQHGTLSAGEGVKMVKIATASFNDIGTAVTVINQMTLQIAGAAEQQSSVAEDVCRRVATIRDVTQVLLDTSHHVQVNSCTLNVQAHDQRKLVDLFQT